jgi:uncharacterized protein with HEPN domain
MPLADETLRLRHMLDHAREAIAMAQGRTRPDLDADRQFHLAMTRLLEIVGEAATRVTSSTRDQHPDVPGPQIVGLRHRLIHGYDRVDFDILWQIVTSDLPPLVSKLEQILS